jgi:hypothetical protein
MLLPAATACNRKALMTSEPADTGQTVADIEAAFDRRWGVWVSDTGCWWATRAQALSAEDLSVGCVPYIQAESPEELTERIHQQDQLSPGRPDA